jgi:predicted phage tail protein
MDPFLINMSRVLMRCNHFSLFSGHGGIQTPSFIPAATAAAATAEATDAAATITASANATAANAASANATAANAAAANAAATATAAATTTATDDRDGDGPVVHAREAPDDAPRETSWSHEWRGLYAIEFQYMAI